MARLDGTPNLLYCAAHPVQPRLGLNRVDLDRRLLRLGEHYKLQPQRLTVCQRLGQLMVNQELIG